MGQLTVGGRVSKRVVLNAINWGVLQTPCGDPGGTPEALSPSAPWVDPMRIWDRSSQKKGVAWEEQRGRRAPPSGMAVDLTGAFKLRLLNKTQQAPLPPFTWGIVVPPLDPVPLHTHFLHSSACQAPPRHYPVEVCRGRSRALLTFAIVLSSRTH